MPAFLKIHSLGPFLYQCPCWLPSCIFLYYVSFLSTVTAVTEYIVGTTHITNGQAMMESVLSETPLFVPTHLWNNPGDEPVPKVTASERGSL